MHDFVLFEQACSANAFKLSQLLTVRETECAIILPWSVTEVCVYICVYGWVGVGGDILGRLRSSELCHAGC